MNIIANTLTDFFFSFLNNPILLVVVFILIIKFCVNQNKAGFSPSNHTDAFAESCKHHVDIYTGGIIADYKNELADLKEELRKTNQK